MGQIAADGGYRWTGRTIALQNGVLALAGSLILRLTAESQDVRARARGIHRRVITMDTRDDIPGNSWFSRTWGDNLQRVWREVERVAAQLQRYATR
jgi:hypothetical protein